VSLVAAWVLPEPMLVSLVAAWVWLVPPGVWPASAGTAPVQDDPQWWA